MTALRLLSLGVWVGLVAACQPSINNSSPHSATPSTASVHNSSNTTTLPAHCENIPLQMSAITNRSDVQSLAVVNQALKKCVPEVDVKTREQWLERSHDMYQRFLNLHTNEQTATLWDDFSWTLEGHAQESAEEKAARLQQQQTMWPKLNARMKQMSKWLGQEYIDNFYVGEGMMQLRRSPQYVLDIFAPHMPEAQKAFMQQLGHENLELTTNDAAIVVPWSELSKRALFWEQYVQQYPDMTKTRLAQYQFQEYASFLFYGSANSPFIDTFSDDLFVNPEAIATHQALAQNQSSILAAKSEIALAWLEHHKSIWKTLSESERERAYKEYQLLIQVPYPERIAGPKENQYYDCSSDAVCHLTSL